MLVCLKTLTHRPHAHDFAPCKRNYETSRPDSVASGGLSSHHLFHLSQDHSLHPAACSEDAFVLSVKSDIQEETARNAPWKKKFCFEISAKLL